MTYTVTAKFVDSPSTFEDTFLTIEDLTQQLAYFVQSQSYLSDSKRVDLDTIKIVSVAPQRVTA